MIWRLAAAAVLSGIVAIATGLPAQAALRVRLVSKNSQGVSANGQSAAELSTTLSRDGRLVTFYSSADNLPGGDASAFGYQSYVRNMRNGRTRLVSKTGDGDPFDADASFPAISANGRFVAFAGEDGDQPGPSGIHQIWLRDLKTGKTRLVSRARNGDPGNGNSLSAAISARGRFVAFTSQAANLPRGDGTDHLVYVRDLERRKTMLASRTTGGDPVTGEIWGQAISSSGRLVAFQSRDADLPGGDGSTLHTYLRNLERQRTRLIDRNNVGQVASSSAEFPSVSGNGRFVAFDSNADNLPRGDGTHGRVYLRDLERRRTKLVSLDPNGQFEDGNAFHGVPSGNARYVAFNAYPGIFATQAQVYVRDRRQGRTRLLSRASNGDPADARVGDPSISLDGRFVTFFGWPSNLGATFPYDSVFRAGPIG